MKSKTGWLVIILIASVHLALSLIAVVWLFSWFDNQTQNTLASQVYLNNQTASQQVLQHLARPKFKSTDIKSNPQAIDQLRHALQQVQLPNYGFACFVDPKSGNALCSNPEFASLLNPEAFKSFVIENEITQQDSDLQSLTDQPNEAKAINGIAMFNQYVHYTNANYQPHLGAVLVVAQQPGQTVAGVKRDINVAKNLVFTATLLLGLLGMCASLMVLTRVTRKIEDQNAEFEKEIIERGVRINRTRNAVIFGLAKLAESRDNDTGDHLDRIRKYVTLLAQDLLSVYPELSETEDVVRNLALASSLHDIGKVGIPDSILLKPGRLSAAEREVMEIHTLIGGECLEAIQDRLGRDNSFMQLATQIALYHHERWDGGGYPHSLAQENIPLAARIVAVADVYDALTSKRPYKEPLSHLESRAIIVSGSGTQFDPEVVAAFLRLENEFEVISRRQQEISDTEARSEFYELCDRARQITMTESQTV